MPTAPANFEKSIEILAGATIHYLRDTPISTVRQDTEKKAGKPCQFTSYFPLIGRDNVLRGNTLTHEQIEKDFSKEMRRF